MRLLKNKLIGVCLDKNGYAGFRVARILRALYDKKLHQVVRIVVRTYGGDGLHPSGYNGRIFNLAERKEFVGPCRGIVDGKDYLLIDDYAMALYSAAKSGKRQVPEEDPEPLVPADEAMTLPPFGEAAGFATLEEKEIVALKDLFQQRPQLLKQPLPGEPYWILPLPDRSCAELFGYGYSSRGKPVAAAVMLLSAWTPPGEKTAFAGNAIPAAALGKALRMLIRKNLPKPATAKPATAKPAAKPAANDLPPVNELDDYF